VTVKANVKIGPIIFHTWYERRDRSWS